MNSLNMNTISGIDKSLSMNTKVDHYGSGFMSSSV